MLRIALLSCLALGCGHSTKPANPNNSAPAAAGSGSATSSVNDDCSGAGTCIALCAQNDTACPDKCQADQQACLKAHPDAANQ